MQLLQQENLERKVHFNRIATGVYLFNFLLNVISKQKEFIFKICSNLPRRVSFINIDRENNNNKK